MTIGATIGDLHLGRSLYGFDLTESTRSIMYRFFRLCVERKADYAVQLGDLFDSSRPAPGLEKIAIQWCNEFERARIYLYLMTGNHDVVSKPGHVSALDAIKAHPYHYVRVIDRPTVDVLPGIHGHTLLFMPFPSTSTYLDQKDWRRSVLEALRAARRKRAPVVAYAHLDAAGAVWGSQDVILRGSDFAIPEKVCRCNQVRQIINGHVHRPQKLGRVLVQGAAQRLRIDEADHARFFYFHRNGKPLHKGKVKIRDAVQMVDLEIDASVGSEVEVDGVDWTVASQAELIERVTQDHVLVSEGAVVRLRCWVNENTAIDWSKVEAAIYDAGAKFVYPIVPQRKTEARTEADRSLSIDPAKAARSFIKQRVPDKSERAAVMREFTSLREEAGV